MSNVYAYRSLVDFHRTSTSGGAFTQLAMNFFAQGGDVVYGVVLDENLNEFPGKGDQRVDHE